MELFEFDDDFSDVDDDIAPFNPNAEQHEPARGEEPAKSTPSVDELLEKSKHLISLLAPAIEKTGENLPKVVPNAIEHTEEEIPPIEDKGPTGSTSTPGTAPTTRSSSSTVSTDSTGSTSMPVTAPATGSTASTVSTGQTVSEEVTGTGLDNPNMEAPD